MTVKNLIQYSSIIPSLFRPSSLATYSLHLRAEQVNDIFKFKKAHLHPPVTLGAALFGLFGNDGIQYAQDRTHLIEVRQLRYWPVLTPSGLI